MISWDICVCIYIKMQRPTFCSASQQLSQLKQNNQEKREERNYSTTDPVHGKLSPPVGPNPSAEEEQVHSFTKKTKPDLLVSYVLRVQ